MCENVRVNNKDTGKMSDVALVSLLSTMNIFHIFHIDFKQINVDKVTAFFKLLVQYFVMKSLFLAILLKKHVTLEKMEDL